MVGVGKSRTHFVLSVESKGKGLFGAWLHIVFHFCHTRSYIHEFNCECHLSVKIQRNPETCECIPIPSKSHMQSLMDSWYDALENSSVLLPLDDFYSIHKEHYRNFIGLCAESFI